MRIWGIVLLVVGSVFMVLFVLAQIGGGHIGYLPFFISLMLMAMGWQFMRSGRGLVTAKSASTASGESGAGGTTIASPTVEMPMTPEIAAIVGRQWARTNNVLLSIAGVIVVAFGLFGAGLDASLGASGGGHALLEIFSATGIGTAVMIYAISWISSLLPLRRDVDSKTYLRTTGPIRYSPYMGGAMIRLADRAFLANAPGKALTAQLANLEYGTLDYGKHAHTVFAAWDAEGREVFRVPGYATEGAAAVV